MRELSINRVCDVLINKGLLTKDQRLEISIKERGQRHKLIQARLPISKAGPRSWIDKEVSSIDIIASFGFPIRNTNGEILTEEKITKALAEDAGLPFVKIDPLKLDSKLVTSMVSRPFARRHCIVPLDLKGKDLVVATANPYDEETFTNLRTVTHLSIHPVVSTKTDIMKIITEFYGFRTSVSQAAKELTQGVDLGNLEQLINLKDVGEIEATDKHIVNAVEYLLHYAFDQRASDIHIEPKRETSTIRLRIDGILHTIHSTPKVVHSAVASRVKMLARLDIAEKRKPQDGRIRTKLKSGQDVELRVSTLPVAFGEKIVVRIFDPETQALDIEELGFMEREQELLSKFISKPFGLILVTGPTGSGKTTTLYAALKTIATPEINVTTIEDPIEMVHEELNQVAVQPRVGITFADTLRNILRQDPDVIMVGEIRDPETASNAVQSALTGHLVLSTLHTNTAVEAITRLIDLGIEPYLISACLIGVLAQRLVRVICEGCKDSRELTVEEKKIIGLPDNEDLTVWYGAGCATCRGTGYYGRTSVIEMFEVTEEIASLIKIPGATDKIRKAAVKDGMKNLREAAVIKMVRGETSFEEVLRVTMD